MSFLIAGVFVAIGDESLWLFSDCTKLLLLVLVGVILIGCVVAFVFLFIVFFGYKRAYSAMPESKIVTACYDSFMQRSEEHTSELQSLMRISYAVFCLKKKNHHITLLFY